MAIRFNLKDSHKKGKESRFSPVRCYTVVDGEPALDSFPFMAVNRKKTRLSIGLTVNSVS
jgi:hypothetical protein